MQLVDEQSDDSDDDGSAESPSKADSGKNSKEVCHLLCARIIQLDVLLKPNYGLKCTLLYSQGCPEGWNNRCNLPWAPS